jgi:hypothetical protein
LSAGLGYSRQKEKCPPPDALAVPFEKIREGFSALPDCTIIASARLTTKRIFAKN